MNRYETFAIFEADTASDERKAILERIESLITARNGVLLVFDKWGGRKLAYPIRKKTQGYYVRIDYCGEGELVAAMEQMLRHDQRVLRFMTIVLESDTDPEALKAAMAETEEATEPVTAEKAAAPTPETVTPETAAEGDVEEKE